VWRVKSNKKKVVKKFTATEKITDIKKFAHQNFKEEAKLFGRKIFSGKLATIHMANVICRRPYCRVTRR
jgi:hypothetical protein